MSELSATAGLLAEVFPGSHVASTDYLRWLYLESPFGPVIETNLDDDRGRAGHYALAPITIARDGVDHPRPCRSTPPFTSGPAAAGCS